MSPTRKVLLNYYFIRNLIKISSKSLVVHVGLTLVHTVLINLILDLSRVCLSGIAFIINDTSVLIFPLGAHTLFGMLSLMKPPFLSVSILYALGQLHCPSLVEARGFLVMLCVGCGARHRSLWSDVHDRYPWRDNRNKRVWGWSIGERPWCIP